MNTCGTCEYFDLDCRGGAESLDAACDDYRQYVADCYTATDFDPECEGCAELAQECDELCAQLEDADQLDLVWAAYWQLVDRRGVPWYRKAWDRMFGGSWGWAKL